MNTKEKLLEMQGWSLEKKIETTQDLIIDWYNYHKGEVYISFSGGKDSTVLLDIARKIYPDINTMFIDTGFEYPEIRSFVKSYDNIVTVVPEMNLKQVIMEYGYPVVSKEIANSIFEARKNKKGTHMKKFDSESAYCKKYGARYDLSKWKFLLDVPIKISSKCCDIMKKDPAKKYEKETGKKPIIGTMVSESNLRRTEWLSHGCNIFEGRRPSSKPLSFWNLQDILNYIKIYDLILYAHMIKYFSKSVAIFIRFPQPFSCKRSTIDI